MRVLVIGAHPDDEDTELLTELTRHYGAEAAYLSLNRGEGGQNLIGPELGEALGILRTEELLAARRLDGARQYFTRAYDFGFSKTLEDTWAHWPQDSVLKDVVRVIRAFRPQVVVSIFSGTPRDGHGQHMAAGWVSRQAFLVSGDSTRFPELAQEEHLRPFVPTTLYQSTRFDTAATTLRLEGGLVDVATGKTYRQTAMESRSLHRSQDMGQAQPIGPSTIRLALLQSRTGVPAGDLWSGIDTTMTALLPPAPAQAYQQLVQQARQRGFAGGAMLRSADSILAAAQAVTPTIELADQRARLAAAWQAATGTLVDARIDREDVTAGSTVGARCEVRSDDAAVLAPCHVAFYPRGGRWMADSTVTGPSWRAWSGPLDAAGVAPTQPYFLRRPRDGAMYDWALDAPATRGQPFEPAPIAAGFSWNAPTNGTPGMLSREFSYRWNDQSVGERRVPVDVVPRIAVDLSPSMLPWRRNSDARAALAVALHNTGADSVRGRLALSVPDGWRARYDTLVALGPGERRAFPVTLTAPAGVRESRVTLTAVVRVAGPGGPVDYSSARRVVSYPHIERRGYLEPAATAVSVMDLVLPDVGRVAYVRGAADRVPEALQAAGFDIEVIPGSALAGSLARFGAVVIGPRAYEVDSALVQHNDRLLAWVRRGGRVIVQYQQYGYFFNHMAPYPLYVASRLPGTGAAPTVTSATTVSAPFGTALLGGHDRVTDEGAAVSVVDAASPVLRGPNRIAARDWDGWVQERGLYFARAWAPEYRTVVSMADAGEGALEGGLLIASVGKGWYTYTGLSFFRQLPAGVPGAFRLFANLLAVGGAR